jgi:hypothetical protein
MRKTLVFAIALFMVSVFTISTYAQDEEKEEVFYTCNADIGAIEIHLSKFDSILDGDRTMWQEKQVPWEKTQKIETIKGTRSTERYLRKKRKPVKYECVLKSGNYVVSFGSHWINANVEGSNGMDIWPTVKIIRGKETILPTTILGSCDKGRSELGSCEKEWAIRIFLFHSEDKPCVTVDRFTKDWIR